MADAYKRVPKGRRPFCPKCGRRMVAGSTHGRIVYYYANCGCSVPSQKVIRDPERPRGRNR